LHFDTAPADFQKIIVTFLSKDRSLVNVYKDPTSFPEMSQIVENKMFYKTGVIADLSFTLQESGLWTILLL